MIAVVAMLLSVSASGKTPLGSFSRRMGLSPAQRLIGEPQLVGTGPWRAYPNDRGLAVPTRFSWTDGTPPVTRMASTESGLFTSNAVWNGITAHDAEMLRRLIPILRYFGHRDRGFLQSREWVPHAPLLAAGGVYASSWAVGGETLWTLVNQAKNDSNGPLLAVAANDTRHFYDCYRGAPLQPSAGVLELHVEQSGFGCVFATANATLSAEAAAFMAKMRGLTQKRLDSFSKTWTAL